MAAPQVWVRLKPAGVRFGYVWDHLAELEKLSTCISTDGDGDLDDVKCHP